MNTSLIFVVEDDSWYADLLEYNLKLNPDYVVEKFSNAEDCIKNLYKLPIAITLDYSLPGCTGGEALRDGLGFDVGRRLEHVGGVALAQNIGGAHGPQNVALKRCHGVVRACSVDARVALVAVAADDVTVRDAVLVDRDAVDGDISGGVAVHARV